MSKALRDIARRKMALQPVDFTRYYYQSSAVDIEDQIQAHADRIFHPNGYLYAPLRRPIEIADIEKYRVLVMVRDPRDVLTSLYFSVAISHSLPLDLQRRQDFETLRQNTGEKSIDEFVIDWLPRYHASYSGYLRLREDHGVPLLRYEDMLDDFQSWVGKLSEALGIELSGSDVARLRRLGGLDQPVAEDPSKHIRQRAPGDHRRKLQGSTIEILDARLREVLIGFGYVQSSELV